MAQAAPKVILLIEDDVDIRETMKELLMLEGYDVVLAENGRDGLTALKTLRPNVILLDLMMPVMDGYAFLEALSEYADEVKNLPIVVLSAGKELTAVNGVVDVIHKPINVDRLLSRLNQIP